MGWLVAVFTFCILETPTFYESQNVAVICYNPECPKLTNRNEGDKMATETETYNGWANYETWNVWLYLMNDERLQNLVSDYVAETDEPTYPDLIASLGMSKDQTPDEVAYLDPNLNLAELKEALDEIAEYQNREGNESDSDSADSEWLASAGFGTDEDYGDFGGDY